MVSLGIIGKDSINVFTRRNDAKSNNDYTSDPSTSSSRVFQTLFNGLRTELDDFYNAFIALLEKISVHLPPEAFRQVDDPDPRYHSASGSNPKKPDPIPPDQIPYGFTHVWWVKRPDDDYTGGSEYGVTQGYRWVLIGI